MQTLSLEDIINVALDGFTDFKPGKLANWNLLNDNVRDGLISVSLLHPANFKRTDWLSKLNEVSECNREDALHAIVNCRMNVDDLNPMWLILAIRFAESCNWKVPDEWVERLNLAVQFYYRVNSLPEAPCFFAEAQEWLSGK